MDCEDTFLNQVDTETNPNINKNNVLIHRLQIHQFDQGYRQKLFISYK
jgi:hypothetical protein